MKNKKMFIILSIVALSTSFAHATLVEDFKQNLKKNKDEIDNDEELNNLTQAIANKAKEFKVPHGTRLDKAAKMLNTFELEIGPEMNTLAKKFSSYLKTQAPEINKKLS